MPFKGDISLIKKKYNKTVLLTFKIYRFLFLTSIFSLIIHFILCLYHVFKYKNSLLDLCKYGIPLNAEENEKDIYFKINNNHLSLSYLISSWNFNFKNEETSSKKKRIIKEELEINSRNQIDVIEGDSESNCNKIAIYHKWIKKLILRRK